MNKIALNIHERDQLAIETNKRHAIIYNDMVYPQGMLAKINKLFTTDTTTTTSSNEDRKRKKKERLNKKKGRTR